LPNGPHSPAAEASPANGPAARQLDPDTAAGGQDAGQPEVVVLHEGDPGAGAEGIGGFVDVASILLRSRLPGGP
jgi:hypothetical protein